MTILSEPGAMCPNCDQAEPFPDLCPTCFSAAMEARFAVYVYSWDLENGKSPLKLYRVTGGKFDGSDVGAERLAELGIVLPADVSVELVEAGQ